ncbi:T6SS immunity protein Tli4 family protein [Cupriavidus taiwanensis]|uniref:T6SS immunity protein Tli4 family protein n=1 Tax=Cupriavidus taiwanensis TaxID=164546 RepID=UPI002541E4FB|nr:T6SS immunity protein Tli4 family protein [Cupriavidus taiwanensis]MDK3022085.1 T6SS immunity protein Tli4 family protein [Cupriavidus taiwanensis]
MAALAPNYAPSDASHTECFGRQIFDIPSKSTFYWATSSKASNGMFENLFQRFNDGVGRGNIEIETKELLTQFAVYGPITEELRKSFFSYRADSNEALLINLERSLKDLQEREERFRPNPPGPNTMANLGAEIAATKKSIVDLKADQYRKLIDLGRANSLAFRAELNAAKPYMHGAVVLGEHIVAFQSMLRGIENYAEPTEHQWQVAEKALRQLISQLRPRELYEVPKDRGFCLPYAFLRDDGTYGNKISTSFRLADSPAVIYTLSVAAIPGGEASETTILNAAGRSATGLLSQLPENTTVKQRLGPRPAKIGALTSEQGGIVVEAKRPGQPSREGYHVYTGYAGWAGSQILPTIEVVMESAARASYPKLTMDAPPYEQSRPRLDALLKSIRLRPTTPPMPELAGIQ